jgi:hypothetical protein
MELLGIFCRKAFARLVHALRTDGVAVEQLTDLVVFRRDP